MAVTLSLVGNEPQRRATVAFRVILMIPHLIFSAVLQMVAFVVIFFAWFAVLFTAEMPKGMGDFLRRVLQYQTHVYAYGMLLTDTYPPFDVGPASYPVELHVDEPGRFNRAAVFFRAVLQLWAMVLSQLATSGLTVILFFVWLVTLVAGRVPSSAFLALATMLRYQMRTWAYIGMLTTEYPGGLLGDKDEVVGPPPSPLVDDPDPELPSSPHITRLVLSGGAKAIVILALFFGAGWAAINVAFGNWSFGAQAELVDMDDDFDEAYETWDDRTRDCSRGGAADCQVNANAALRDVVQRYQRRLLFLEVPESAIDEGLDVVAALDEINALLGESSESSDADEQLRLYFLVEDAKLEYEDAYDDLYTAVSFG